MGTKTVLWNKLIKEVRLKRVAGPFDKVPFKNFIQSPIGLVPKAGNSGQTRLIFHLSYDFGTEKEQKSLNYHTPKEECSVRYNDLDDAIAKCLEVKKEGQTVFDEIDTQTDWQNNIKEKEAIKIESRAQNGSKSSKPIYLGKSDIKSVFRLVRLSVFCFSWLVMSAKEPCNR